MRCRKLCIGKACNRKYGFSRFHINRSMNMIPHTALIKSCTNLLRICERRICHKLSAHTVYQLLISICLDTQISVIFAICNCHIATVTSCDRSNIPIIIQDNLIIGYALSQPLLYTSCAASTAGNLQYISAIRCRNCTCKRTAACGTHARSPWITSIKIIKTLAHARNIYLYRRSITAVLCRRRNLCNSRAYRRHASKSIHGRHFRSIGSPLNICIGCHLRFYWCMQTIYRLILSLTCFRKIIGSEKVFLLAHCNSCYRNCVLLYGHQTGSLIPAVYGCGSNRYRSANLYARHFAFFIYRCDCLVTWTPSYVFIVCIIRCNQRIQYLGGTNLNRHHFSV